MNDSNFQIDWQEVPLYPDSFKPFFDSFLNGSFHLPAGLEHNILLIIFVVFSAGYAIVSAILFYHWYMYGMRNPLVYLAEIVFSVVSALLFALVFYLI